MHGGSVFSKTAIFPKKEGRNREISDESARGSSLRKANVQVSAKGTQNEGQDTVKALRTIIWYKRACIRQTTRQRSLAVQPLKKDVKCRYRTSSELENSVLEINQVTNVTTVLNETTTSDRVSRLVAKVGYS